MELARGGGVCEEELDEEEDAGVGGREISGYAKTRETLSADLGGFFIAAVI